MPGLPRRCCRPGCTTSASGAAALSSRVSLAVQHIFSTLRALTLCLLPTTSRCLSVPLPAGPPCSRISKRRVISVPSSHGMLMNLTAMLACDDYSSRVAAFACSTPGVSAQFELNGGEPVGFSIPATEHSVMTAWHTERAAIENMIDHFGDGLFACVMDSYDYMRVSHADIM